MARQKKPVNETAAVSRLIRDLRAQAGMTQQELALHVGTSPRSVQRWEQHDDATTPTAIDLLKVLSVFGIDVPRAPRFHSIADELRRIYDRIDEALAPAAVPADVDELLRRLVALPGSQIPEMVEQVVAELNQPTPPARRRRDQMQRVADELGELGQLAQHLAVALQARLEASDTARTPTSSTR